MDRPASQKFLRVLSVLDVALGVLSIVAGVVALSGGTFLGVGSGRIATEAAAALEVSIAGQACSLLGVLALLAGLFALVEGALGLRAARDATRIMPVWAVSFAGLVLGIANLAITASQQGDLLMAAIGMIASALMFWVANNIRSQA